MASPMGGILAGLMAGYDQQNELLRQKRLDQEQRDERGFQRQRQVTADQRAQTEFQNTQDDRTHMLSRRPTLEAREDSDYGLQSAIRQMQVKKGAHDLDRMPVLDQQQDAKFALDQEATRASIAHSRASSGLIGVQSALANMGISEKQIEQQRQHAQDALMQGIVQGRITGDWSGLVNGYNATIGKAFGGAPLDDIKRNDDGTFTAHAGGGAAMHFGDVDQLMEMAGALTSPEAYMKGMLARQAQAARASAKSSMSDDEKKAANNNRVLAERALSFAAAVTNRPIDEVKRMSPEQVRDIVANHSRAFTGPILGRVPFTGYDLDAYAKAAAGQQARVNNPTGPVSNADFDVAARSIFSQEKPPQVNADLIYDALDRARRTSGATAPAPAAAAAQAPSVARPQTAEDFGALPSGAMYVDPDDGRTYRKP